MSITSTRRLARRRSRRRRSAAPPRRRSGCGPRSRAPRCTRAANSRAVGRVAHGRGHHRRGALAAVRLDRRSRKRAQHVEHALPAARSPSRPRAVDALAEPGDDRLARAASVSPSAISRRVEFEPMSTAATRHHDAGCGISPPGERGEQVVDGHVGHARARARSWPSRRAARRAGSARCSSGSSAGSGSGSVTSSPAPAISPSSSASRSATWSTTPPRAVLIKYAVCFIRANCGGADQVAGLVGQRRVQRDVVGPLEQLVQRRRPEERELWMTSIPKPSPRRAIAWPIRPQPTIPSVVPAMSPPSMCAGYHGGPLARAHLALALGDPAGDRRAAARRRCRRWRRSARRACCRPGCRASAASSRSMLSVPTARLATALTLGAASKNSRVDALGDRSSAARRPSRRARAGRRAAAACSSSQTSTSCSALQAVERRRRASARVTKTLPTGPMMAVRVAPMTFRSSSPLAGLATGALARRRRRRPSRPAASRRSRPRPARRSRPARRRPSRCASRARARSGSTSASPRRRTPTA